MQTSIHLREMINRLARLDTAVGWEGDLNPTQRTALIYLARANRFSRSPSNLSDYLGTTRGTTSQSLKSLLKKGYVREHRSEEDKRVITYELTQKGQEVAEQVTPLERAVRALRPEDKVGLQAVLTEALRTLLLEREGPSFGLCRDCIHHKRGETGPECLLLAVALTELEADQICCEQENA